MIVTNALGLAFAASVLSVGDAGVTFVFPEDGATNTLAFADLSEESAQSLCREYGYVRIPPELAPAVALAKRDLARLDAMLSEGRIEPDEALARRKRILSALRRICRDKGFGELVTRLRLLE